MATLNLNKKKFLSEENVAQIVKIGINFGERLNSIESEIIADYDNTKTYLKGESCYHNNYIYRCKATATGDWDFSRWELIGDEITELTKDDIKDMLGLSDEELETLSKIILDSEVRLDKTYSSSKIYTDIQNAIDTAKAYTLSELGKMSGASYKVVSATSEMTDEKVIYLLQNGSTYDMYIVDGGAPTKIGDTNIDLSNYYTKTEINNDFLKKTDATSTYATKTEANDKVDKISILSATSSTATDDNLYSAKLINDELNKKLNANELVAGGKGEWSALQCDLTDGSKSYRLQIGNDGDANIFASTDNWSTYTFKKVCVTSIANSSVKDITFIDSNVSKTGDYEICKYCVLNGICYVTLNGLTFNSSYTSNTTFANLPKPMFRQDFTLSNSYGDVPLGKLFLEVNGGIHLYTRVTPVPDTGFISFSYPVAES